MPINYNDPGVFYNDPGLTYVGGLKGALFLVFGRIARHFRFGHLRGGR